jgi:hypothetical protein
MAKSKGNLPKNAVGIVRKGKGPTIPVIPKKGESPDAAIRRVGDRHQADYRVRR